MLSNRVVFSRMKENIIEVSRDLLGSKWLLNTNIIHGSHTPLLRCYSSSNISDLQTSLCLTSTVSSDFLHLSLPCALVREMFYIPHTPTQRLPMVISMLMLHYRGRQHAEMIHVYRKQKTNYTIESCLHLLQIGAASLRLRSRSLTSCSQFL